MMRETFKPLLLLLVAICALGCSQPPNPDGELILLPAEQVVELGTTAQFGALVRGRDEQSVIWQVVGVGKGSISQQGLYQAPQQFPSEPTVRVRASTADEALEAEALVRLIPAGAAGVIELFIAPDDVLLALGGSQQMTASGLLFSGELRDVTALVVWSSSEQDVATIDAAGVVTGVSPGEGELRAALGALRDEASVEVDDSLSIQSLTIEPDPAFVSPGDTEELKAFATLFDGSVIDVTNNASWSINDPSIATIGNTSGEEGRLTGVASGGALVSASFGGLVGVAAVLCSLEVERCDDNQDNDQDGLFDCQDPDCDCDPSEVCQDESGELLDEDQDGLFDCQDPDCIGDSDCVPGGQAVGASCNSHSDCEATSAPACLESAFNRTFLDGYCSELCDLQLPTCGAQGVCGDVGFVGGEGLCFATCVIDGANPAPQGDCRSGYECTDFFFSASALICYPL